MFYTIMLATRLSEGLDLSQFDRIQYLDMVQKGFNEQYPDNGSGREDFTFGKVGLPDDLKFDVDVTFLDLEDPDRRTDYVNVNIPRASPERFGKTDGMETDETEQASSDPVFGWEYGEREGAYLNDIEEAWALFSKGSLNKKGVRPS